MEFVRFGDITADAYLNMAMDEAILHRSGKDDRNYIRFYEFSAPSFILAYRQHPSDIIASGSGMHVTRRLSSGGAMLCDGSSLAYSIVLSAKEGKDISSAHGLLGTKIAEAVKEYARAQEVSVGEHFSVRVNGKIIAGHGQRDSGNSLLYHGVLALYPWNTKMIEAGIRLNNGELEYVRSLPCLSDYSSGFTREDIEDVIAGKITGNKVTYINDDERDDIFDEATGLAREKYMNSGWINFGPGWKDKDPHAGMKNLLKGWGFCFADVQSPEPVSKRIE